LGELHIPPGGDSLASSDIYITKAGSFRLTKASWLGAFIQAFEVRARLVTGALYATGKALSYKAAKLAASCFGSVDASQAPRTLL
jgi:hypothetical protein